MNRLAWQKKLGVFASAILLCVAVFVATRSEIKQPVVDRGQTVYLTLQKHVARKIGADSSVQFSPAHRRDGTDWHQTGSNVWEVFGTFTREEKTTTWHAIAVDRRPKIYVGVLEIGGERVADNRHKLPELSSQ